MSKIVKLQEKEMRSIYLTSFAVEIVCLARKQEKLVASDRRPLLHANTE